MGVVKKCLKLLKQQEVKHVQRYLMQRNKKLTKDEVGNLYLINPDTVLICAHMDTVRGMTDVKKIDSIKYSSVKYRDTDGECTVIKGDECVLGADDRAGIAIAMQLYETYGDGISLLFTVGEESGGIGSTHFVAKHRDLLDQCTYAIIPDRMGDTDVICTKNNYGSAEFEDNIMKYLDNYGFSSVRGVRSDCNHIKDVLNCFNISVGYYHQHTNREMLVTDEMEYTLAALENLIENYNEKLAPPPPQEYKPYRQMSLMYPYQSDYDDEAYYEHMYRASMSKQGKKLPAWKYDDPMLIIYRETVMWDDDGETTVLQPGTYYMEATDDYDLEEGYEDDDISSIEINTLIGKELALQHK